uniref:Uncharacterized protein n=1 Tax=Arion vulgaris TaxID=1028688 RepID=A0A0B7A2L4_9EUPU
MGPHKRAKLDIMNKLPRVYKAANFLAFSTNRGIYKDDKLKQNVPINKHMIKPKILCFFVKLGSNGSDCASINQPLAASV